MKSFISSNVTNGIYFRLDGVSFQYVKSVCESKYERIVDVVNVFLEIDRISNFKNLSGRIFSEPFITSRIYGLFKIHKDNYPVRPIVSSTNCMGKPLEKWMLRKLELIAKKIGKYQIKNARQLFNQIDGKKLEGSNHVLVTWDFDSMFTNIPFQKTKEIVRKYYYLIQNETSMPVDVFLEALTFLIEDCAFFTFADEIYLQAEGLAMGNSLSQVLAEITTSFFMNEALSQFNNGEISFIYKYVDDIFGAVDETCLTKIQNAIEEAHGMKLKVCRENEESEVDYLQMKIRRKAYKGNLIDIRWFQKEYGSKNILNFHSYHPLNMRKSVVTEFIRNALKLSSSIHWEAVTDVLRETLKNSNYSRSYVNRNISRVLKEQSGGRVDDGMKYKRAMKPSTVFLSCPYYPGAMNSIRNTISKMSIRNVSLAPTIISNNRNTIFSNMKDKHGMSCIKNASFVVKCSHCSFSHTLFAVRYDIVSTLKMSLADESSILFKHCKCEGHSVNAVIDRKDIVRYKNGYDLRYAKEVLLLREC